MRSGFYSQQARLDSALDQHELLIERGLLPTVPSGLAAGINAAISRCRRCSGRC